MNRTHRTSFLLNLLLVLGAACATGRARLETIAPWRSREIAPGVTWSRFEGNWAGAPQAIHVLSMDPHQRTGRDPRLGIVVSPKGVRRFSSMAEASQAIAGVNGGFFDIRGSGGPVGYLKVDGLRISENPASRPARGVVAWSGRGAPVFVKLTKGEDPGSLQNAMGGVPLLLKNGENAWSPPGEGITDEKFIGKNPRTAIGLREDGSVVLVTVDGRRAGASGFTLPELAAFLRALGCVDALNLDGGGSTTCWVRGEGVVNQPSDLTGERPVANGIVISTDKE